MIEQTSQVEHPQERTSVVETSHTVIVARSGIDRKSVHERALRVVLLLLH